MGKGTAISISGTIALRLLACFDANSGTKDEVVKCASPNTDLACRVAKPHSLFCAISMFNVAISDPASNVSDVFHVAVNTVPAEMSFLLRFAPEQDRQA